MRTLLNHCHLIVDGNKEYLDGAILLNGDYIEEVFPHTNKVIIEDNNYEEINLNGLIVMPGFIDTHLHGSNGYDFRNIDKYNLNEVADSLIKHGTTAFFATINGYEDEKEILNKLNDLSTSSSKCLGVHLEGPFLSKDNAGVSIVDKLLEPNVEYLKELLSINSNVKQVTIAPELKGSKEIIEYLKDNGIKVMFGHSNAYKKDINNLYYDGFTHFYNAMTGFNHRDLGLVNMGFNNDGKYIELIADGIHIDNSVLKHTINNINRENIILISDAISSAGLKDGTYSYNGEDCIKEGRKFYRLKDNKLSGSCSFIIDEIKNMKMLNVSYTDLLLMSSLNAARFYGLDNLYGSLYRGKYADLVILDDELNIVDVYIRGKKYA